MKRRAFLGALSGAAVAWPLAARAQQPDRVRTVGLLIAAAADDPEFQGRIAALRQGLAQLGWSEGRNLRIDIRWATTNAELLRKHATELVALAPDVIVSASGTTTTAPLIEATRTLPIVFVLLIDPVGAGFVASLARPGGNVTGFLMFEYGMSGKWLELLKQIAPNVTRAAVVRDPAIASGIGQFGAVQSAAPSFGLVASPINLRDASEIDRDLTAFAKSPNGGLIVTASPRATQYRDVIIALAARYRLPAVYASRHFVTDGGLISYGPDIQDQYRRTADYVDRVLKGEKTADLPVQAPTKFELLINLKTAKTLGIEMPTTLVARADELIE
jgi:putative ABC transport system substrate-binding protein